MKSRLILFYILVTILLAGMLISVGIVKAANDTFYNIIYSKLSTNEQGPDEIFTIPQYNLVCVYKGNSLDCLCPCSAGICSTSTGVLAPVIPITIVPTITVITPMPTEKPTVIPTFVPTTTNIPINTPIPPTAIPNGVFIRHYDANGTLVWEKCMPVSAWNGHKSHPGHVIQDENLGFCYR